MNFDTLIQDYLVKLETHIGRCESITTLINEVRSDIPINDRGQLIQCEFDNKETVAELRKFYEKIKQREFKIAVVGLEGSGKSTFINSLIKHDFLPTKHDERCTLASVELKQSNTDNHVAYVTYKTAEDISDYLKELDDLIKNPTDDVKITGTNSLVNEKEEFERYKEQIDSLIAHNGGRTFDFKYDTLDMLRDSIKEYIIDSVHARAVKNITISTKNLFLSTDNKEFVLYDVPGYDSPLKFHKDQTQKSLKEADLIIFVHSISERADLKEGQIVMMTISDNINKSIKTKDKLFVFLNKVDRVGSIKDLEEKITVAKRDWLQYCRDSNIYYGSAQAHLAEIEAIEDKYESVSGINKLGMTSGIIDIKNAVNKYLETERFSLISSAIRTLFRKSDSIVQVLLNILEKNGFKSEHEGFAGDKETVEMFKAINLWWDVEKGKMEDEFEKWYFENVLRKEVTDNLEFEENPKIMNIKTEHLNKIDMLDWDVDFDKIERQILRDMSQEIPQINASNIHLRKEHHELCMQQVEVISKTLSTNLRSVANDIISWIYFRLYEIDPVKQYFYSTFNLNSYEPSMSALYIRHARPLVDVFIKAPHGTDDRKIIVNARKAEVNSLKISLEINLSFDLLKSISQIFEFIGLKIVSDDKPEQKGIGIPIELGTQIDTGTHNIDFLNISANNEIELKNELETDTKLLVELLKETAFESSGIMEYCYQELDKVRRFFKIHLHEPQLRNMIIDHLDQIPDLYNIREKVRKASHKKRIVADLINKLGSVS